LSSQRCLRADGLPCMRMQRTLWVRLFLAAAFCTGASVHAQQATATATHHSLWKVQGKTNAVYLLCSVHVLKETNYPLPAPIEQAFTNSQIVVFETDMAAMEDPALAMKMMAKGSLPEGQTLEQQLSPELYKAFQKHVEESGIPSAVMDKLTPAMAAMTLEVFELMKLGLEPEAGVDKHFYALAKKEGKKTVPLETVDFQIALLSDFSKEE